MLSKLTSACLLLTLFTSIAAQTPAGFEPKVYAGLPLQFGADQVTQGGDLIPREQTANPPTFNPPAGAKATGLIFMIDLDISNGDGQPRTTFLHWLAYNVDLTTQPAKVPIDNGAPYWQPSPPLGDGPHRYVVVLYNQPDNFVLPAGFQDFSTADKRQGFNLTAFSNAAGLNVGLAANFIEVQNGTATATSTMASSTGASAATSATAVSGTSSSHAAAPTQFIMEWSLLTGAGLLAAVA